MIDALALLGSLLLILLAAEGFTNGTEVLGKRFSFSQAVVGSILAAVGTALPETVLPLVAILFGSGHEAAKEIGVGAILGAPFMLSTVAFCLVGVTVLVSHMRGRHAGVVQVEQKTMVRDLQFFIVMYAAAIGVPLLTHGAGRAVLAVALIAGYCWYVALTVRGESAGIEHYEGLHLSRAWDRVRRRTSAHPHLGLIILQIVAALVVMVCGARLFVGAMESVSLRLGMSPLLFSLLCAPIATELPEKFNSVTWVLKKKDALAMGNITGAMVFQSTFPVSVGLLCTPWHLSGMALWSALMALSSAMVVLLVVRRRGVVPPWVLAAAGTLYVLYAAIVIGGMR